jgi:hypothetical protein
MANAIPSISYTSTIWIPKFTALWWHLKWIFSGGISDIAINRVGFWSWPLAIYLIVLISCSFVLAIGKYKLWHAILLLIVSIVFSGIMVSVFRFDPANRSRSDLADSQNIIRDLRTQDDLVLIKSYGTQAWAFWMNWGDPDQKWMSLPYFFPDQYSIDKYLLSKNPADAPNNISRQIIQKAEDEYERIWLVLPDDSPGSNLNWEASFLAKDGLLLNYWFFSGDGHITRLYLFDLNRN